MNFARIAITMGMLVGLMGCTMTSSAPTDTHFGVVSAYTKAFNDRDIGAMSALMHPDIQWLSVEGDKVDVFANGKADLVEQMTRYMNSPSATTSALGRSVNDGAFIAVREVASYTRKDGSAAAQSSLAVYEVKDGLIARVWYYPSTRGEP